MIGDAIVVRLPGLRDAYRLRCRRHDGLHDQRNQATAKMSRPLYTEAFRQGPAVFCGCDTREDQPREAVMITEMILYETFGRFAKSSCLGNLTGRNFARTRIVGAAPREG
jgi:hypothetical protein